MKNINVFVFPFEAIASINILSGRHWSVQEKYKSLCLDVVGSQLADTFPMNKCNIKFIEFNTHLRDRESLAWGAKYPIDSLVHHKLLKNDNPEETVLDFTTRQYRVHKRIQRKYVLIMEQV